MYYKVTETETINALQNIIVGNLETFKEFLKATFRESLGMYRGMCFFFTRSCFLF